MTFTCSQNPWCPNVSAEFYSQGGSPGCTNDSQVGGDNPTQFLDVPTDAQLVTGAQSWAYPYPPPYLTCNWGMYMAPLEQAALPGPNQGAPSSYSATVTSSWTPPSEDQQKQNATSILQSPAFDPFNQYQCAKDGPSGPCPFWPLVPVPSASESASSYSTQLTDGGFQSNVITLPAPEAEWSIPAGDVVYTSPAAGESAATGSTVDVYVNPQPVPDPTQTGEKDDPSCDRSTPSYVAQSQQTPSGFTAVSDPTLVSSSTFNTTLGPTVLNYGYASLINTDPLDFGGWGYWHILAGHGWSLADDADTRAALEDPTPEPGTNTGRIDSYVFYGPKYLGTGNVACRRVVLVEFGTAGGDPGPKGIITSYGADVTTLRPGLQ